jgi:hypothetical protein
MIFLNLFISAAFPNTALKARSYSPGMNVNEAKYYQDLVAAFDWKALLEHIPDFV